MTKNTQFSFAHTIKNMMIAGNYLLIETVTCLGKPSRMGKSLYCDGLIAMKTFEAETKTI